MSDPHDDLDDLLTPRTGTEPSPGLRDAILHRTNWVLLRHRQHRVYARLVAVIGLLAVGGAIGWAVKPVSPQPRVLPVAPLPQIVEVPVVVPVPVPMPVSPVPVPVPPPASASQLELRAEQADDPGEAARLYRQAGDRYLTDREDYRNAHRCYRLYLIRAGDTALSPDPGDTWLLTSLKNEAFKEKTYAARNDG